MKPADGGTKKKKRIGRGQGSGAAGTAGRGHNGQKSRSGYSKKIGFEGGQMPLQRRVPKFGFKNPNRVEYKGVNLDTLQTLAEDKKIKDITPEALYENGLVGKKDLVKILGRGELKAKLTVKVHGYSASAKAAIESAGGSAAVIEGFEKKEKEVKPKVQKKKVVAEKKAEEAPKADDASTEEE